MAGSSVSQMVPTNRAASPVRMNVSGSIVEEPVVFGPGGALTVRPGAADLLAADLSNEASIGLFLGFACEAARFELSVEMDGTTIGSRPQFSSGGKGRQRFQNADH